MNPRPLQPEASSSRYRHLRPKQGRPHEQIDARASADLADRYATSSDHAEGRSALQRDHRRREGDPSPELIAWDTVTFTNNIHSLTASEDMERIRKNRRRSSRRARDAIAPCSLGRRRNEHRHSRAFPPARYGRRADTSGPILIRFQSSPLRPGIRHSVPIGPIRKKSKSA